MLDGVDFESLLLKDNQTGLCFLPAATRAKITHTAEILGSGRVRELLRGALDRFDMVIVDTSPLLPVTDGRALMPAVDAFIMVAHWGETNSGRSDFRRAAVAGSPGETHWGRSE